MGCLNENGSFGHWFGNIHLSGPCNAKCYFCVGQHMMALDSYNNLKQWPLAGIDDFIAECKKYVVTEVNLTGTNTDPLLYTHIRDLVLFLRENGLEVGIRTNGIAIPARYNLYWLFDKVSVSIPTIHPEAYEEIMGVSAEHMPSKGWVMSHPNVKINVVLTPEGLPYIHETLHEFAGWGVKRINLREPYGQPHIGNPLDGKLMQTGELFGMPQYRIFDSEITYWDVHYVEVESVNLYANGRVSVTYPITKGHDATGEVHPQDDFSGGRVREQWTSFKSSAKNP